MKTNFEAAVASAIETVAELLNESTEYVARKAMEEGPVRDSVVMLTIHAGVK